MYKTTSNLLNNLSLLDLEKKNKLHLIKNQVEKYWNALDKDQMQENEKISEACARAATREVLRAIFDNESRFDEALFQWAYNVMKFDDN